MQNDVYNTKRNKQEKTNVVKLIRSVPINSNSSHSIRPQLNNGPWSPSFLVSIHVMFYGERLSAPRPTPNLKDQVSIFVARRQDDPTTPLDTG